MIKTANVLLRQIKQSDLPTIYRFQLDPVANEMAFTRPRSQDEFDRHWENSLTDPNVVPRAIVVENSLAGCINCFNSDDKNYVGYWICKPFWGKGIATAALKLLLNEVDIRPLHSRVATTNAASIRVLEKCGFREIGREWSPASDRYLECEEVIMKLSA